MREGPPGPATQEGLRFGLEIEFALAHPDRGFLDFVTTPFEDFQRVVDRLPDHCDPDLTRGDLAIKWTRWYVEGDERFDAAGTFTGCAAKGIETRTPIRADIAGALAAAAEQAARLREAAAVDGLRLVVIGFNPVRTRYRPDPPYNAWELAMRAAHPEYAAPEVYMLSYGPDVNLSHPSWSDTDVVDIARKLNHYSAALVPFSFSAPFAAGQRWPGYSVRVHERAGRRPAARAFVAESSLTSLAPQTPRTPQTRQTPHTSLASPFVCPARLPAERGRVEFKAFDPVAVASYGPLLAVVAGLALDNTLPGRADHVDVERHRAAARSAFDDDGIRAEAAAVLAAARGALRGGYRDLLQPLEAALAARRTPAHDMIERYDRAGDLFTMW